MVVSLLFLGWGQLKRLFSRLTLLIVTAVIVVIPWIIIAYRMLANQNLNQWIYALQMGNPASSLYSGRYPLPIFFLVKMA